MFRSSNNSMQPGAYGGASKTEVFQNTSAAIHNCQDGTRQMRYHWPFRGEVELPASGGNNSVPSMHRRAADELDALLDRVLAFAG